MLNKQKSPCRGGNPGRARTIATIEIGPALIITQAGQDIKEEILRENYH